jgi:hypothetical protein
LAFALSSVDFEVDFFAGMSESLQEQVSEVSGQQRSETELGNGSARIWDPCRFFVPDQT